MLLTSIALAFFLQPSADGAVTSAGAARPGQISESWTLEYDIAILPYIQDYRRCLNYGNRVASGVADFEQQHRADLPRCEKTRAESIEQSVAALGRRGLSAQYPPEQVAETFYRIGQIHIERGRFIDDRFDQRQAVLAQYRATHERSSAPLDQPSTESSEETESDATNP